MAPPPRRGPQRYPQWVAFGQRLKALRAAKGWASYEVADMIGVDPATMSQWENARRVDGPKPANVVRLAELYKVSMDSFPLGETGQRTIRDDTPDRPSATLDTPGLAGALNRAVAAAERLERAALTPADASARPGIRAAVYDALLAIATDLFESIATASRERAAAHHTGEVRGGPESPAAKRVRRH